MGIFNGSFVDHSWICLLDRASGYVDKSFRENSLHNCFMRKLQGVSAHCNYRYIALPRGSRASPGHRSAASTDGIQAEAADTPVMHNNKLCYAIYSVAEEVL